jgi:hypothetical protein
MTMMKPGDVCILRGEGAVVKILSIQNERITYKFANPEGLSTQDWDMGEASFKSIYRNLGRLGRLYHAPEESILSL